MHAVRAMRVAPRGNRKLGRMVSFCKRSATVACIRQDAHVAHPVAG